VTNKQLSQNNAFIEVKEQKNWYEPALAGSFAGRQFRKALAGSFACYEPDLHSTMDSHASDSFC